MVSGYFKCITFIVYFISNLSLPQNWSLVLKSLRTDDLEDFLKHRLLSFIHRVPGSGLEDGPGIVFLPSSQVILILSGRTQSPIKAASLY